MSTTLTWASSGNATKTGTTINTLLDDLDTLITSKSGDATFFWQKAGKSSASTPFWLLLSPKDGSNRRIAIICWTSTPAANNAAILDTTPGTNSIFIVYFPNGNVNTLSNLTAASGTICGNDTGVVKCAYFNTVAGAYAASFVPYYLDCADGMIFFCANPASANAAAMGAGSLLVDASDVAYDCTFGSAGSSFTPGSGSSVPFGYTSAANAAGSASAGVRTNYGSSNRAFYNAWTPAGAWGSTVVGSTDILTDTSNTKAWFVPIQLLSATKGDGFLLKLRQIAIGPNVTGPFTVYNTTGPVVAARSTINATVGSAAGYGWVTNFKV